MATTKPRATQIRGLAKQQAPYLFNIIPDSYLPDSTGDVDIYGEFFTPDMTVSADGQIINYFNFINSGHIKVNMTRGSAEGTFGLTLDNGIEAYFPDVLLIVLGSVLSPNGADWVNIVEPINFSNDEVLVETWNSEGSAVWDHDFDYQNDFWVRFSFRQSQFGNINGAPAHKMLQIVKSSDLSEIFYIVTNVFTDRYINLQAGSQADGTQNYLHAYDGASGNTLDSARETIKTTKLEFRWNSNSGVMYLYKDGAVKKTFTDVVNENMRLKINVKFWDIINIKEILPQ